MGRISIVPIRAPGTLVAIPDGRVEVFCVDEEVACQLFMCFRVGTVGDDRFMIPNADACRRGCRLQWHREILIARCNLMSQADRLLKHRGVSGFTERNKVLFIVIDEQHIFHRTLLRAKTMISICAAPIT